VVALLGPNGAGKSTSLLAIAGGLVPSAGRIRVGGADLAEQPLVARSRIGFADQPPALYDFLTVGEQLEFVAETRGTGTPAERQRLLADLGLSGVAERLCRELSFGMRQRVGLAAALIGDLRLVLLDETLNGLDPRAAKAAREVVGGAARRGAAVLMSTHLLGVAERLATRIVIMDRGQVCADVAGEPLQTLLARGPGGIEELYLSLVTDHDAE
jgi:ABC-2 type transport system ATP-binding protein